MAKKPPEKPKMKPAAERTAPTEKRKRQIEKHVAQRLKKLRVALGVPPKSLAERAGITQERLAEYEAGTRKMSPRVLAKLAKALTADIERFLTDLNADGDYDDDA
jgi:transcriptional regulator with XRE-family HTH domain